MAYTTAHPTDKIKIIDPTDKTKKIAFAASGITTGTTRTITMPDSDVTLGDSGQSVYDVIVAASGGDYTSIYTAFNTEGSNKSYLIRKGTYSETSSVVVPDNCYINWQQVVIDYSTNNLYFNLAATDDTTMVGNVTIQGDGVAVSGNLVNVGGSDNDFSGLTMQVVSESTGTNSTLIVQLAGSDNDLGHIIVQDISVSATGPCIPIWPVGITDSKGNFTIKNIDMDTSNTLSAMRIQSSSLRNVFNILIYNVTNASGGANGLAIDSGNNYNCIYGVSQNTSNNLSDSGTGNKTGEVAV